MLDEASWVALGVAAALVGTLVLHKVGWIQISIMRKAHKLNVNLATPKIDAVVKIERRTPTSTRPDVVRYFLLTTIHNEGQLAAAKINGNWNLSCSDSGQDRVIPIARDYLGQGKPYDLEPQELGGYAITNAINSGHVRINVDINLNFVGLAPNKPEKYSTKYRYDPNLKEMVRG
jgi:hypothetical protein